MLEEIRALKVELRGLLGDLQAFAREQALAGSKAPNEVQLAWEVPPQRNYRYGRRQIPTFSVRATGGDTSRALMFEVGVIEAGSGQRLNGVLKGELTARLEDGCATFGGVILHLTARPSLKRMLALNFVVRVVDLDIRPIVSRTVIVHNRPRAPLPNGSLLEMMSVGDTEGADRAAGARRTAPCPWRPVPRRATELPDAWSARRARMEGRAP